MYENKGEYDRKKTFYRYYDSIEDLVQYLKTAKVSDLWGTYHEQSSQKRGLDGGFHEFTTYEEAFNKLEFGYDKHFAQFMSSFQKAKDIVSKIDITRVGSTKRDVAGFMPIIPNALLGLPESMINSNRIKKPVPKARIFIEMSEHGGVSTKRIIDLKSVVFALIDLIERQGIRCEIWATENSYKYSEITSDNIKLKDYFQPLNVYKLQFPIISPDMLRRIHFRMLETNPNVRENWYDGYGKPMNCTYSISSLEKLLKLNKEDIYIPNTSDLGIENKTTIDEIIRKLLDRTKLKNYIKFSG